VASFHTTVIDIESFISTDSTAWLQRQMNFLGHPQAPDSTEFLTTPPNRRFIVPDWYRDLRDLALRHTENGQPPYLSEAPGATPLNIGPEIEAMITEPGVPDLLTAAGYDTDEFETI